MIIFGTRGVTYSNNKGQFHCPSCGGQQAFNHKRVRRFFTLYFIPVIPLDLLGEYVECQSCRDTFKPVVLDYDPTAKARGFEAEFHKAIKRVMVMMMMSDGTVDDAEIETIRTIYKGLSKRDLSEDDVRQEIGEVEKFGLRVQDYVANLRGSLNDGGKEIVVRAAFHVAAADGTFAAEEQALLAEIGTALEITPAHMRGLLATLKEDLGRPAEEQAST